MDLILRQGRVLGGSTDLVDIGIDKGRIAAIEANLSAEGPSLDLAGRLVVPGMIETHIHLDKSRILGRCQAQRGDLEEAIAEVAKQKKSFTAEDVHARQGDARAGHPARHDAYAHAPRGRPRHRSARLRGRSAPDQGIRLGHRSPDLHLPAGRHAE